MAANPEHTVKIIVVGNSDVGKTSLLYRFCQQTFHDKITSTIGCDFNTKTVEVGGRKIKLQIWDTAGQEKTSSSPPSFFRNCEGAILTYSIDNQESFARIETWMKQVNNFGGRNAIKILVGNKRDSEVRVVTTQEAQRFAVDNQIQFFETSAKEDYNVTEAFYGLVREIKETILDREENPPVNDNIKIHNKKTVSCWERVWNWFKFW